MMSARTDRRLLATTFRLISPAFFAALITIPLASFADPISGLVKIRADGSAPGQGAQARTAAVEAAKGEAVLLWVQSLIGDIDRADILPILNQVNRYAESSRVIEVQHDAKGTTVSIEVYVRERTLRVDVAALLLPTLRRPPRAVLLIAEQGPGEAARRFDASSRAVKALTEALGFAGIVVEEADTVRGRYTLREMATYLQGGLESIAKFGRENRADVVIAGNVIAHVRPEGRGDQILRAHATVELSIVRSDDALLYDTISTEAEVSCTVAQDGARMAIEDAIYKAREATIVGTAIAALRQRESSPGYELTLTNPRDWRDVELVADRLRSTQWITHVEVLRSRPGAGLIRFEYAGKMSALVERLTRPFADGRRIETQRVVGNELEFIFATP